MVFSVGHRTTQTFIGSGVGNGEGGGEGNGACCGGGMGDGGIGTGGIGSGEGDGISMFMVFFLGLVRERLERSSIRSRPRSVCAVPNAHLGLTAHRHSV
ncbi:MAG: hypothetical protein KJ614_12455 [Gammaproteobacteria bacterium]|uniref:hypothetical protein n=1 Tax=Rhodoferax sp. TaxID=50421 RepID=UPI0017D22AEB|nr:hypothetical protein [Rhodoferax sp.]MBU3899716.1 hypothetical protein [Gammaproteobacteria bacterium]MBA3056762.1 hypothetical protein [Rhodoferax sp.]MBU3996283.1 hypothetical protein [Gammaproteobacteria bacterium]MBU4018192.1 hypothetical protein [Gammaproteobacteria bacterium]MBU4172959.1 hypothetical protein [Gammaproteobacteria bacterium]